MEAAAKLTATVERVLGTDPDRVMDASKLITEILANHPEYGGDMAAATAIPWPATTGAEARASEYLGWIEDLYDRDAFGGELHGRAAVLAAGLVDRGAGRAMASVGLFQAIADEIDTFASSLGEDGQARLASIPLARVHIAGPTRVLDRPESGGSTAGIVVAQSRDGRWIAVGEATTLTLFRGTYEVLRRHLDEPIRALAVDAAGRRIMVGFHSGWGVFDRTDSSKDVKTSPSDAGRFGDPADPSSPLVHAAAADGSGLFRADGPTALQLSPDGGVRPHPLPSGAPTSLHASPSGRWLAAMTPLGAIDLVDTRRGTTQTIETSGATPPGDLTLAVADDGTLARAGVELSVPGPSSTSGPALQVGSAGTTNDDLGRARALAFSPDGAHVVGAGPSGGITMLEVAGLGVVVRLAQDHPDGYADLGYSGDGHWLLAVRDDGSISQWQVGLTPAPEPPSPVAYVSDRADGTGDDLVGIDHEVEAFASLIAARDLEPPLSVGIFGDWGSGKTFFMRRLRDRVEERSRTARESGLLQREVSFAKRIIQVEFNAWHYSEGELWAALVEHIFANLSLFGGEPQSEVRKRQQHLVNRMQETEERRSKLSRQSDAAKERADSTSQRLCKLKRQHREALQKLRDEHARDAVDVLTGDTTLETRITQLASTLGLPPVAETTTATGGGSQERDTTASDDDAPAPDGVARPTPDGAALLATRRLQGSRSLLASASPLTAVRHGTGFWHTRTAMFLTVVAVPTGAALGEVATLVVGSALDSWAPAIGAITGLLAAGSQWWTEQTGWVEEQVAEAEALAAQLDQLVAEAENEHLAERAALEKELDALATQIATVEGEMLRSDTERERLDAELSETTPASVLASYIMERAASDDYRRHLGLHARIKEDFDRIASIMDEDRATVRNAVDLEQEERDADTRVDRIVLYIDDLDRCEANKVVEVLAAVHLLLAFPLFVVVVGLDARWGSRALRAHYREMFGDDGSVSADPQDYLEKIFQVPFWLAPLDRDQAAGFVAEVVGGSIGARVATSVTRAADGAEDVTVSDAGENGVQPGQLSTRYRPSTLRTVPARPELNPASLRMDEDEVGFLRRVASLLGTSPRAVKRFVNVYRLAKSLASDPLDFATHRPGYGAPYEAVMVLLAIDTGMPNVSAALFQSLTTWTPAASQPDALGSCIRSLAGWRDGLGDATERDEPGDGPDGAADTSDGPSTGAGPDHGATAATASSAHAVRDAAQSLLDWIDELDDIAAVSDMSMQLVRSWIPTISRYSYRARAHATPVS